MNLTRPERDDSGGTSGARAPPTWNVSRSVCALPQDRLAEGTGGCDRVREPTVIYFGIRDINPRRQ